MIEIENFENHLNNLSNSDWHKLFCHISKIEKQNSFGELHSTEQHSNNAISMHYWEESPLVDETLNSIFQLKLTPVFDWSSWEYGKEILGQKGKFFPNLDSLTLCKLLTMIIRADRFNEGFLIANFENGIILNILKNLQKNQLEMN